MLVTKPVEDAAYEHRIARTVKYVRECRNLCNQRINIFPALAEQ